ncbi:MAG: methyl-accepting chemotaxis protein [Deltaproteobacteria bacterium]|nr:methyl-accepting chemotaxis protein [Deltaproteobacteria bacterium]
MTIRGKLIAGVAATSIAIAVIAAASTSAILKIRDAVGLLTDRSTPLQIKTVSLQQTVEKLSADFLRLGMAAEQNEIRELSSSIDSHIGSIEKVNAEIRELSTEGAQADPRLFRDVHRDVLSAVETRRANVAIYRQRVGQVNEGLARIEANLAGIGETIRKLNAHADETMEKAQAGNNQITADIKTLLTLQAKLKDAAAIINEFEAVRSKYKFGPMREKLRSVIDSIESVCAAQCSHTAVKVIRTAVPELQSGGTALIKLREDVLSGRAHEDAYASSKRDLLSRFAEHGNRIAEATDSLEISTLKGRERMSQSRRLLDGATSIASSGNAIGIDVKELASSARLVMLASSAAEIDRRSRDIKATTDRIGKQVARMKEAIRGSSQEQLLGGADSIGREMKTVEGLMDGIVAAKRKVISSDEAFHGSVARIMTVSGEQSRKAGDQVRATSETQKEVVAGVNSKVRTSLALILALSGAVVAVSVVAGSRMVVSISKPIRETVEVIGALGNGDLTRKTEIRTGDEIGMVGRSVNGLVEKLHSGMSQVSEKSDVVVSSAHELSSTAEQLSKRAQAQYDEVKSLAASAEEISAVTSNMTKNAESSVRFAEETRKVAFAGDETVRGAVDGVGQAAGSLAEIASSIDSLKNDSGRIGEIAAFIKEVTEQINLLSLNAAIEAARAGDAGRGFAVVADSVRQLADKTATAAEQIGGVIASIHKGVSRSAAVADHGRKEMARVVERANLAGASLREIVGKVERQAELIRQMATASAEQSTTVETMAANITRAADISREFVSASSQISSTGDDLNRVAVDLQGIVRQYKL